MCRCNERREVIYDAAARLARGDTSGVKAAAAFTAQTIKEDATQAFLRRAQALRSAVRR